MQRIRPYVLLICTCAMAAVLTGCTSAPKAYTMALALLHPGRTPLEKASQETLKGVYPLKGRMVHRAVLTIRGREFPLDGYLSMKESDGLHLVVDP